MAVLRAPRWRGIGRKSPLGMGNCSVCTGGGKPGGGRVSSKNKDSLVSYLSPSSRRQRSTTHLVLPTASVNGDNRDDAVSALINYVALSPNLTSLDLSGHYWLFCGDRGDAMSGSTAAIAAHPALRVLDVSAEHLDTSNRLDVLRTLATSKSISRINLSQIGRAHV